MIDDPVAHYMCSGDPSLNDYYPPWLTDIASDATVEGSMIDGVIVGGENVRSVVLKIKSLYGHQGFLSVGPFGENDWIEDYVANVGEDPIGCVVLVKRDNAGQTQHVIASYRPRTSVNHFANTLADEFAGTELEKHFRC
jgi:hypothetical protein